MQFYSFKISTKTANYAFNFPLSLSSAFMVNKTNFDSSLLLIIKEKNKEKKEEQEHT